MMMQPPHHRAFRRSRLRTVVAGAAVALLAACGEADRTAVTPASPGGSTPPSPSAPAPSARAATPPASPSTVRPPASAAPAPAASSSSGSPVRHAPPAVRPTIPSRPLPGPRISFGALSHDFGRIWDVGTHPCRFEFVNTGTETLIVSAVKPACGCTAATLDKTVFKPGEGSSIEVEFDPTGAGTQKKRIDVFTNASPQSLVQLTITADIQPFVVLQPAYLLFGTVATGEEHVKTFAISSPAPEMVVDAIRPVVRPITAFAEQRPEPFFSARLLEEDLPAGAHSAERQEGARLVEVTIHDNAPWGTMYASVEIDARGRLEPNGPEVTHTAKAIVNASVYGELQADDQMFRLSLVPPGGTFEKRIQLTRPPGVPFRVLTATVTQSSLPGVTIRPVQMADGGYDLVLAGRAGQFGQINGYVTITTDVPGEELLHMRFAGVVRDSSK